MFPRSFSPSWVHLPGPPARAGGAAASEAINARTASRIGMARTINQPDSIRVTCEHLFVDNPNTKGAIAELEIELAATRAGIPVLKPVAEHGRTDLGLEIGDRIYRVQCKWGRITADRSAVAIQLSGSRLTPVGYVRTTYAPGEVDFVGVYCGE